MSITARGEKESNSAEPDRPDRVDGGVGYGGCQEAAAGEPRTSIEDAGDSGENHVAPVEVCRAFVEVGEAEQERCDRQRPTRADAAFEHVEHQSAKEELFRHCDEKQREQPSGGEFERAPRCAVEMQKA